MNFQNLRIKFQQQVYPSQPNEWDIEDALVDLEELSEDQQLILLQAIPTIWPISHSLSFSFLKEGARNGRIFSEQSLAEWLRRILFSYEQGGLKQARAYMAESDIDNLLDEEESESVVLEDNLKRFTSYTRGLSGLELQLQQSPRIYTDTEVIYLPDKIDFFPNRNDNILTYTLLIGLQTSFITLGSFGRHRFLSATPQIEKNESFVSSSEKYFSQFKNVELAKDIYQLLELSRVMRFLNYEYPGLLRETVDLRSRLKAKLKKETGSGRSFLDKLFETVILPEEAASNDLRILDSGASLKDYQYYEKKLHELYALVEGSDASYQRLSFLPFMDTFDYAEAERIRELRIKENRKKFETLLADFLLNKQVNEPEKNDRKGNSDGADSARIQIVANDEADKQKIPAALVIDNESIALPEELKNIIDQIVADQGALPEGYVSAAFGIAGHGRMKEEGETLKAAEAEGKFIPYDEWDYRRQGYRKNWCGLRERTLKGVKSQFLEKTINKHRRILQNVRRQFEMMRTQERFIKRRRFGNDVDLDALIDSLGDQQAGLPPSEKLFIRLIRNERSISTYFLVDMSNSTAGWVGTAIKEALVILCEAMEVVGDNYAIYGFSGMRRMRSEVYKIKDIRQNYSDIVKQRLAAISPKEYTRMGPPIRHMINHFRKCDTKTKLLLILSDGKPEDYDDYKGRYAIEDTRKALAEARGHCIHPYCITIDREAHDYLEYMFGRGNYTFVKDIQQLPSRLTEIYRLLTR